MNVRFMLPNGRNIKGSVDVLPRIGDVLAIDMSFAGGSKLYKVDGVTHYMVMSETLITPRGGRTSSHFPKAFVRLVPAIETQPSYDFSKLENLLLATRERQEKHKSDTGDMMTLGASDPYLESVEELIATLLYTDTN